MDHDTAQQHQHLEHHHTHSLQTEGICPLLNPINRLTLLSFTQTQEKVLPVSLGIVEGVLADRDVAHILFVNLVFYLSSLPFIKAHLRELTKPG